MFEGDVKDASISCPSCAHVIPESSRFCSSCGEALGTVSLLGLRHASSSVLELLVIYIFLSMTFLFALFLLRALLRRQWLAATVFVLVLSFPSLVVPSDQVLFQAVTVFLVWSTIVIILIRFGFVALVGCLLFSALLFQFPATSQLSAWYWSLTMVGPLLVFGVCLYAFVTSLAGRPFFKGTLFQE